MNKVKPYLSNSHSIMHDTSFKKQLKAVFLTLFINRKVTTLYKYKYKNNEDKQQESLTKVDGFNTAHFNVDVIKKKKMRTTLV